MTDRSGALRPEAPPGGDPLDRRRRNRVDQERIGAELLGLDDGTDPFVAAVRATRMPMIVTDPRRPDNPIVFCNDAFCRLTGYARPELLGRNCRFLQGPDTDPEAVARVREAVAQPCPIEIDLHNVRKDGSGFWNRLLLAPVHDGNGELAYFFASQLDVTIERERLAGLESRNTALMAELGERLRAEFDSQARLRLATEAGRLGIWELDLATDTLVASRIFLEDFGRDPALPFDAAAMRAAIHPADAGQVAAAMRGCAATGTGYDVEHRVLRPDGGTVWLQMRAQVQRAPDGSGPRFIGTSLDITARRTADRRNQALLELDDRFRALDDPDEMAFVACRILGQVLEVDRVGYALVDPVADTVAPCRDWTAPGVVVPGGPPGLRELGGCAEALKRGEAVVLADAARDPGAGTGTGGGAAALVAPGVRAAIVMPVLEESGLVALLFLHHARPRDWRPDEIRFVREVAHRTHMVAGRRRAEQAVRRLAADLENQVQLRTEALMKAEEALRQSQKMEAVGQLTGGLAHDFNNLLTGIAGSLELLRTRVSQNRVNELDRYIAAAEGAADRAAALTHRLLAFSRRQTLAPRITDANRLVSGMEELIRRTAGPAIEVSVDPDPVIGTILVDASQLENALLNLCINARDAMPDGGRLSVQTRPLDLDAGAARPHGLAAGAYVAISVSDTGSGMTPDVIAKAFDPFFTTKPIGQGTGLGLSMIYGFAMQSGGQTSILSAPGRGTTVRIMLPRHDGVADRPAVPGMLDEAPRARPGETVLVVDDEPTVRMLVAEVLQDLGYVAIEAEEGAGGLAVLRSDARIDLLVTDVGLPGGVNGRQLADAARILRPGLRVLFITGYAESAVLDHGHLEPGMHVLVKPFAMELLARRIKQLVSGETVPAG